MFGASSEESIPDRLLVVSFLGALYYYGVRDFAMRDAGQIRWSG